MEIWKDVKGTDSNYQISNEGRVKSIDRVIQTSNNSRHYETHMLKPYLNTAGYWMVTIKINGEWKKCRVHRLLAEAWIPNPDNKPCIDHINGNRSDNRIENLRWCTYKENSNFAIAHDRLVESHSNQTNEQLMKTVQQFTLEGELVAEYKSSKEAADAVGCTRNAITKACRNNEKVKGYVWKYKEEEDAEEIDIIEKEDGLIEIKIKKEEDN